MSTFQNLVPLHNYIWWFLAGSTFYQMMSSSKSKTLQSIIAISLFFNLIASNFDKSELKVYKPITIVTLIFFFIFCLLIYKRRVISIMRTKAIIWLGALSYEFYLVHESIGISVMSKLRQLGISSDASLAVLLIILTTVFVLIVLSLAIQKMSIKLLSYL